VHKIYKFFIAILYNAFILIRIFIDTDFLLTGLISRRPTDAIDIKVTSCNMLKTTYSTAKRNEFSVVVFHH
jgi:hypothetical protein